MDGAPGSLKVPASWTWLPSEIALTAQQLRVWRQRVQELGETEVEQLHLAQVGQHDVRGLDVAVQDAVAMGGGQTVRKAKRNLHEQRQIERQKTAEL